ncbi:hypothetical protein [Sphingomonas sp. CFBP9021]|uniref:hypothetical protein n=1 Tax=Sphingomonas sp. CFBP9021 TaxID=3096534 RepID=UPI002A6B4EA2|nr:hypothetical protein [Sphingomonas sp. CFBP9021]
MTGSGWMLPKGWYVSLHGETTDLQTWLSVLTEPLDAKVFARQHDTWFLTSARFDTASNENDVRGAAYTLLDELNVRMAIGYATLPISLLTVDHLQDDGTGTSYRISTMSAFPTTQPAASQAVRKSSFDNLPRDEKVRRLLNALSNSTTWEGVYRTLEYAEHLVGDQRILSGYVADRAIYPRMRQIANSYRHITVPGDPPAIRLDDVGGLLRSVVRVALSHMP